MTKNCEFHNTLAYYAPPLIGGGIKRWRCLTSVCLTSVYLSRTSA